MGDAEGRQAVETLNQKEFNGKILNINRSETKRRKTKKIFRQ